MQCRYIMGLSVISYNQHCHNLKWFVVKTYFPYRFLFTENGIPVHGVRDGLKCRYFRQLKFTVLIRKGLVDVSKYFLNAINISIIYFSQDFM